MGQQTVDEPTMLSEAILRQEHYRVLAFLLNHPDDAFSVNEIAEKSDVSRQFAADFIDLLQDLGVVSKRRKGNMYLISLNPGSAYTNALRNVFSLDSKPLRDAAEGFAEEIYEEFEDVLETVVLFGSVARQDPTPTSDIDLFFILADGTLEEEEYGTGYDQKINASAEAYSKRHNVHISPHFTTHSQFVNELRAERAFAQRIVEEGIVLEGERVWDEE